MKFAEDPLPIDVASRVQHVKLAVHETGRFHAPGGPVGERQNQNFECHLHVYREYRIFVYLPKPNHRRQV